MPPVDPPPAYPFPDSLAEEQYQKKLEAALFDLRRAREAFRVLATEAGRSDRGRYLNLTVTEIERAILWAHAERVL